MKLIIFVLMLLIDACSTVSRQNSMSREYVPESSNEIIYNQVRYDVINLYDIEQLSKKFVFVYFGTENDYHLLVAIPSDKFNFQDTQYYALDVTECEIPDTYYPEQSLFYNLAEVKNWKAITVANGVCVIKEDSQLRFLFD